MYNILLKRKGLCGGWINYAEVIINPNFTATSCKAKAGYTVTPGSLPECNQCLIGICQKLVRARPGVREEFNVH